MNQQTIVKLFQIIMKTVQRERLRSSREVNHVTEKIKTPQSNEIHQVQYIDRIDHKMQRSLKLTQVQYINKIISKVQQIT